MFEIGIVHLDIKPSNILMDIDNNIFYGDFEGSKK